MSTTPTTRAAGVDLSQFAGHTPAPLTLLRVGNGPSRLCPCANGNESVLTVVEEDGTPFAAVLHDADARLFAAAPALAAEVAALRDALAMAREIVRDTATRACADADAHGWTPPCGQCATCRARAAVARWDAEAKGRG